MGSSWVVQLTSEKKPLDEEVLPGEGVSRLSFFFSSSSDTTTCPRKSYGLATAAAFSSSEKESLASPGDAFGWMNVGEEEAELLPVQDSNSSLMPRIISSSFKSRPNSSSKTLSGRNSSGSKKVIYLSITGLASHITHLLTPRLVLPWYQIDSRTILCKIKLVRQNSCCCSNL